MTETTQHLTTTFDTLHLHPTLSSALLALGYTHPTPVQCEAIPAALAGSDLLVSSQTGSGKTAAFMLPALQRLLNILENPLVSQKDATSLTPTALARQSRRLAMPKMLVLVPTRELALQVMKATTQYSVHMPRIKTVAILGGVPYVKQAQLLAQQPDILVATPGRLIDHVQAGKISFEQLQMLVLDEADRMLDMGFIGDIEKIVAMTPSKRQTMLFSATLEGVVGKMARQITRDPHIIRIHQASVKHAHISQKVFYADSSQHKEQLLGHCLEDVTLNQAIIFTATKREADVLAAHLIRSGFAAAALHGDMQQSARNRTLDQLRKGRIRLLVATDVAARGIDVPTITHVFNYHLPKFAEDYVHRIGRTGRAGRAGVAISFVEHSEVVHKKRIERFIKQTIPIEVIPGLEPQERKAPPRHQPNRGRVKKDASSYINKEHKPVHIRRKVVRTYSQ